MTYRKGIERCQICLPRSIEDMVSSENPVRVIDAFVDSLDMHSLGFLKAAPALTGRPAYDPRDLLKLYLYGYFNRIRSSRKLMQECKRNIELFFLLRMLTPDFRTISDFRKDNPTAIRAAFVEFTKLCLRLGLYTQEYLAIDGSKFRAQNANKKMYNDHILASKLQRIEENLSLYFTQMQQADQKEALQEALEKQTANQQATPPDERSALAEKIQQLKQRKQRYEAFRKELKDRSDKGPKQKLITDPQARMMHSHKDGYHCCYNVQTAVDSRSHIIMDYLVSNHVNDQGILHDFCRQIKQTTGAQVLHLVADKGYDSKEEITTCLLDGILCDVGFKDDKHQRLIALDYIESTLSQETIHSTHSADIAACLHAGVLPACYEDSNVSVEIHDAGQIGAFTRGMDKSFVICPMGERLNRIRDLNDSTEYACKPACRKCTNRCTASKRHKVVRFGPQTRCVAALMYGDLSAINTPPPEFVPNNSFFQKNPIQKTVLIRIQEDIAKQKQRLCISEHPFGTVKWYHGAHYVLCRGIEKVTAELGLSFLAYNLTRAINLIGVPDLVTAIMAH